MITFLICLMLLIASYFTYGKYVERMFGAKKEHEVPSKTHFDGVDYIPMPMWKTFLIQFLNIAGLGPIFGAVLGATFGPVVFLWITLGGIFIGAVQDYASGMMSIAHKGLSFPEIVGIYLGKNFKQFMRVFTVFLMVLVGAVFMVGPAGLIAGFTQTDFKLWIGIIIVYYIVATLLPIDKIIGRVYPVFGFALLFMALALLGVLIFGHYVIPELSSETFRNMKIDAAEFPLFPVLFITVACGAVSGFHATQSPLMARCVTSEMQGRPVFFGAMIVESIVALIWAAIAMAFFNGVEGLNLALREHSNNAAWGVSLIANTTLGQLGAILALLGVVFAPITSGDTAFRSARLIVADFMGMEQKSLRKRLYICIPLFIAGFGITLINFDVIWRYFAWANQTLAAISLWAVTMYLVSKRKNFYLSFFPAILMTLIVCTYLFTGKEMFALSYNAGLWLGGAITAAVTTLMILLIHKYRKYDPAAF
ncbi:MAG: carbon starvation protein A [Rikenellaceae bacterium]|nr:carbon starvation protein A [Rikenellaceae bacterium]